MGGDGGVIAAKREYMQSCGDVFGMKGGMAKTALNRTETAELRTKVTTPVTNRPSEAATHIQRERLSTDQENTFMIVDLTSQIESRGFSELYTKDYCNS